MNPYESVKSKASKGARKLAQQYEDFDEDELRKMLIESMSIGKKKKPTYRTCPQIVSSEEDDDEYNESVDEDDDETDSDF